TWWPRGKPLPNVRAPAPSKEHDTGSDRPRVELLYIVYALTAVGLVAPMVFLVDFVARGLNAGEKMGSFFWVIYGLGAMLGPPAYGYVTDRLGAAKAVRLLLALQALALVGLAMTQNLVVLGIFTFIVGSFPPGIVPMTLGWIREIHPNDAARQNIVWSRATIVFAAFQALAGYGYSAVFSHSGGNYALLFEISAAAIVFAFLPDMLIPLLRSRRAAAIR
ncbi:MAG TPA: YbfB/YjiJ family MFS transporter, partial [Methylovirgula sp.]